jgi:hypothetical protein
MSIRALYEDLAIHLEEGKTGGVYKTCKYCSERATKGYIWADGRAIVPVCDAHGKRAKHRIVVKNKDAVAKVVELDSAGKIVKEDEDEWDLWTHPEPEITGDPSWVFDNGRRLVPIDEKRDKDGKLKSKNPRGIRRCVVDVFKKGGSKDKEGLSRAFAICTAAMQKAGQVKAGSRKLTKKGTGRATYFARQGDADDKDDEYERIVKGT